MMNWLTMVVQGGSDDDDDDVIMKLCGRDNVVFSPTSSRMHAIESMSRKPSRSLHCRHFGGSSGLRSLLDKME